MEIRKPGTGNDVKVSKLLSELHDLRAEVAKHRGEAISFHDHAISESALEQIYFKFKDFLKTKADPCSR